MSEEKIENATVMVPPGTTREELFTELELPKTDCTELHVLLRRSLVKALLPQNGKPGKPPIWGIVDPINSKIYVDTLVGKITWPMAETLVKCCQQWVKTLIVYCTNDEKFAIKVSKLVRVDLSTAPEQEEEE